VREALPRQPQGEGICVRAGRLLLSSEGVHSAVVAVPVPPGLPPTGVPSGAGSPSGSIVPSGSVGSSRAAGSSGHSPWLLPVMGAAAAVLLGATWFGLRRRH
jgi:hypothetical protein